MKAPRPTTVLTFGFLLIIAGTFAIAFFGPSILAGLPCSIGAGLVFTVIENMRRAGL